MSDRSQEVSDEHLDNPRLASEQDAKPSVLTEQDLRNVIKLLLNVMQTEGSTSIKKRALMQGLAELVDADSWIWTISRDVHEGGTPVSVWMIHGGLSESQISALLQYTQDTTVERPEDDVVFKLQKSGEHFTRRRQQMMPDEAFKNASGMKRYGKQINIDQYVFSIYPLDEPDMISAVGMHRRNGRPPFSEREARLIHIVCSEIRWLHYSDIPANKARESLDLTPRQRTVFMMILQGTSPRDIAGQLEISIHTVNDHIKAIYRHFHVASRNELIARFMQCDGGDTTPPRTETKKDPDG
ncbi:helix-turn-helix transcriptional regulator [Mucisphaera calidilacus]|uniref:Transcriptional regulator MalT n=1 Tax=Mucisphaera calidilacus TaxID=2527982 RepID=A0A518BXW1_9BACT|nr:helix-turn-helix transcriptional regulator [Mucisphaera calidilacus]QDU71811.1 transcriptional regulator MalT [Mucisphaera calidilacus]